MRFSGKWYKALNKTLTGGEDSQALPAGTKGVRITNQSSAGADVKIGIAAGDIAAGKCVSCTKYYPQEFEIDSDVDTLYFTGTASDVVEILCFKE